MRRPGKRSRATDSSFRRFGDGPSFQRLLREHSELFPKQPIDALESPFPELECNSGPTVDDLSVTRDLLRSLGAAIKSFWQETEYIYQESISAKHPSLETRLAEERRRRAGRGLPWDPVS